MRYFLGLGLGLEKEPSFPGIWRSVRFPYGIARNTSLVREGDCSLVMRWAISGFLIPLCPVRGWSGKRPELQGRFPVDPGPN